MDFLGRSTLFGRFVVSLTSTVLYLQSAQQRGISGFFDGASLRLSRKVASSAIGWAVYEGLLILANPNGRT